MKNSDVLENEKADRILKINQQKENRSRDKYTTKSANDSMNLGNYHMPTATVNENHFIDLFIKKSSRK